MIKVIGIPFSFLPNEVESTLSTYLKQKYRLVGMLATPTAREFYFMEPSKPTKPLQAISDVRPLNKDAR